MWISVVEDEKTLNNLITKYLEKEGYNVRSYTTGEDAVAGIDKPTDLWVIDIMLPDLDGFSVFKEVKNHDKNVYTIFISARNQDIDRVVGLELGCDDYIPKPFGMMALVARIKAVLRRTEKPVEEKVLRLGELSVNPTRHVVQVSGETVNLTLKEFELLCLLLDNPGVVFTRDQLLNQIWGYSFDGESRTVDVHVRHLRQKLGDCGNYIETVRGIGYRSGDGKA